MITNVLDLMKLEGGLGCDLVEEAFTPCPELEVFPAGHMDGSSVELSVRTDLPKVVFRHANQGITPSKSEFENRTFQAAILESAIQVDKAMIDSRKPAAKERFLYAEELGHMTAALRKVSMQTWYGTAEDEKGFVGIIPQMNPKFTINAGGTASNTSIYFLCLGEEKVEHLYANNKTIELDAEYVTQTITRDGKQLQVYEKWLRAFPCLRVANKKCVVRIKNIGVAAGKTATWSMLGEARDMMDTLGIFPTHIFLNPRSRAQLRDELRSELNKNPETPKEFEGIPFVCTPNILNNETI